MTRALGIMVGAVFILLLATFTLVIMPHIEISTEQVPDDLKPYTEQELKGRQVYISQGCVYCHSQQPRDPSFASGDRDRGWGRPGVPGDYTYDKPHLLGTMRTGPDLFNIGARQPSQDWHLIHLYDAQAVSKGSIMPPYRFLFKHVKKAEEDDVTVKIPDPYGPKSGEVVATQDALDLVAYLQALDHTYPAPTLPKSVKEEEEQSDE